MGRPPYAASDWYRVARVRCGAEAPEVDPDASGAFFAIDLQSHCLHPLVARLGADASRELLRRALVRYLHATSVLEVCVVNVVASRLAHGPALFPVSPTTRVEALQLYCDEGYHAVLASDLLLRLGCDEATEPAPAFVRRLDALVCADVAELGPDVTRFLFAVISETVLTATLARLGRDPGVLPSVRSFALDHAKDEARHGALFSSLFDAFWRTSAPRVREAALAALPALAEAFLAPDLEGIAADLERAGLDASARAEVLGDVYSTARVRAAIAEAARPTRACLTRAGAPVPPLFGERS